MECQKCKVLLSEYLDGRLEDSEAAAVSSHIAECLECRTFAEELERTVALVSGLDREGAPADFAQGVAARLERRILLEAEPKAPRRKVITTWRFATIGGAVAASVLVGFYFITSQGNKVRPLSVLNTAVTPPATAGNEFMAQGKVEGAAGAPASKATVAKEAAGAPASKVTAAKEAAAEKKAEIADRDALESRRLAGRGVAEAQPRETAARGDKREEAAASLGYVAKDAKTAQAGAARQVPAAAPAAEPTPPNAVASDMAPAQATDAAYDRYVPAASPATAPALARPREETELAARAGEEAIVKAPLVETYYYEGSAIIAGDTFVNAIPVAAGAGAFSYGDAKAGGRAQLAVSKPVTADDVQAAATAHGITVVKLSESEAVFDVALDKDVLAAVTTTLGKSKGISAAKEVAGPVSGSGGAVAGGTAVTTHMGLDEPQEGSRQYKARTAATLGTTVSALASEMKKGGKDQDGEFFTAAIPATAGAKERQLVRFIFLNRLTQPASAGATKPATPPAK